MKRRVCVVAASEMTVRTLLRNHIVAMQEAFDVTVVTNTTDRSLFDDLGLRVRLLPVAIERGISLRKDVQAFVRLVRLFRRERFDLVHSITPKAGLLAMVAGFLARAPVRVHTFTGQVWATRTGWGRALLKNLDRLTAASATYTIVDSSAQRDFLLQERVLTASKSTVLGKGSVSGIDGRRFRPDVHSGARIRGELKIPSSDMVLLFIGRLNRDKGVLDLAHAFAHVADVRKDVRLLIVGVDEQNMRPLIRDAIGPHTARLHFVEFTSEPESFMAASDVLCLPSYREGFSTVILEAAAVGIPSVASRIYGVIDTMEEGRTGLNHPPGNVNAIAETLLRILSDPDLRRRLGTAARERALRDFSPASVTGPALDLYERLLRQGRELKRHLVYRYFGKRLFDLTASILLLILLAPILVLVAIFVLVALGTPVFFRQSRPGLHGVPFTILKFRTMAELHDQDGNRLPDGERLLPIGRFLRATSLDELPELWNVIRGDMSLVGPRPLLMQYLPRYSSEQARRHDVKPGITGWAQVNGRNALTWEQKFTFDLWYVDHLSVWLDLRILQRTVRQVVSRKGTNHPGAATAPEFMGSSRG